MAHADRLGELAAQGRLALFLGADASVAAGLPSWSQLPAELAQHDELAGVRLDHLSPTDAAQAAQAALGAPNWRRAIAGSCQRPRDRSARAWARCSAANFLLSKVRTRLAPLRST